MFGHKEHLHSSESIPFYLDGIRHSDPSVDIPLKNPDVRQAKDAMSILSYKVVACIVTRLSGWTAQVINPAAGIISSSIISGARVVSNGIPSSVHLSLKLLSTLNSYLPCCAVELARHLQEDERRERGRFPCRRNKGINSKNRAEQIHWGVLVQACTQRRQRTREKTSW